MLPIDGHLWQCSCKYEQHFRFNYFQVLYLRKRPLQTNPAPSQYGNSWLNTQVLLNEGFSERFSVFQNFRQKILKLSWIAEGFSITPSLPLANNNSSFFRNEELWKIFLELIGVPLRVVFNILFTKATVRVFINFKLCTNTLNIWLFQYEFFPYIC